MSRGGAACAALLAILVAPAQAQAPLAGANEDVSAFGHPAPGADFETLSVFRLGNAVFRQEWTPAGEGVIHFDGLGPLFNARSCEGCHVRDGRGRPPEEGGGAYDSVSMILKLGQPTDADADMAPDPVYGHQLQDFALPGIAPEGRVRVDYEDEVFTYPDDATVTLRRPRFALAGPGYGPLAAATVLSPRISPQMIGLGLLALVPEEDILAGADPGDMDGDGVSGRANRVAGVAIGRFGWKAGQPTLAGQAGLAFSRDIGVATPGHPEGHGDCTEAQTDCRLAPDGRTVEYENLEAHSVIVEWVATYSANLAVPDPRDGDDPDVAAGRVLFAEAGCAACHRPSLTTGDDPDQPHLSGREIAPYTDLLLHDMGEALSDGFREGGATGSEWRTAPLWGIGLTREVNGHMAFLHDGRARSLEEAILWHGGEAEAARGAFAALGEAARARLIHFVGSL